MKNRQLHFSFGPTPPSEGCRYAAVSGNPYAYIQDEDEELLAPAVIKISAAQQKTADLTRQQVPSSQNNPSIHDLPSGNPYACIKDEDALKPSKASIHDLPSGNPYACIKDEDALKPSKASIHDLPSGNPYARIEDEALPEPSKGVTGYFFKKEATRICAQYSPTFGTRTLLKSEFKNFIDEGRKRDPKKRAEILDRLKAYDLNKDGDFTPLFNRELSDQLAAVLGSLLE